MTTLHAQVELLVQDVTAGRFLEAIEKYYADDGNTREPGADPIVGKGALLEKERRFLASVREWHRREALQVLVTGAISAIHWRFELTRLSGQRVTLEEVALQEWRDENGSPRIANEQYFPLPPIERAD